MLLVEISISGTTYYVSNKVVALTHFYDPYIQSFSAPKYQIATRYGGYVRPSFGDIVLSPDLFSNNWPPPDECSITAKYTATTEAAATTLFSGKLHLQSFDREAVQYRIYATSYSPMLLFEGIDYEGNIVPFPRAFGSIVHEDPLRVVDNAGRPTYNLASLGTAVAVSIIAFSPSSISSASIGTIIYTASNVFSNSDSVTIEGTTYLNGTYTINNVATDMFTIATTYHTESLPINAHAFKNNYFRVYDDGVPISTNATINGDGTFSLTASPVGRVTVSGSGQEATLDELASWVKDRVGISSLSTVNSRSISPTISYWAKTQRPTIDFLSDVSAFFTHLFYVSSASTLTMIDMLTNSGVATITEFDFFNSSYAIVEPTKQISTSWQTQEAANEVTDTDNKGHYIKSIDHEITQIMYKISSGTNSTVSANKLISSISTFITDGVKVGMVAKNVTTDVMATISSVSSETILILEDDIFPTITHTFNVGAYYSYGNELTVEPFHRTLATIATALQDIFNVLSDKTATVKVPISASLPSPGKKYVWPDTSLVQDSTMYILARTLTYDFDNEEVLIEGEGVFT